MKCCVDCGRITQRTRCPACQRTANAKRNAARRDGGHTDPEWIALSRRVRKAWVSTHGWWCPGDEHHGHHPTHDLTVHHPTPLANGGGLLDQPPQVICRSWNSRLGARSVYRDGTDALD